MAIEHFFLYNETGGVVQYRIDTRSGNKLSILGFGGMRFPRNITGIDMRKTETMIMRSIEGGLNYFDTAWIYPGSEEALGTIFEKNHVREKIFIASKLPLFLLKSPEDFDKYFYQTLKRLRTGYIDYYLLHMVTDMDQWEKLKSWGIVDWIAEKKKAGHIRQIGFSFHGSCSEFLKVLDDYDWEICLIQYNYSDENFQAGVTGLRKAAEKMPVAIMEPLWGGRLAVGLPKDALAVFKKLNPDLSPAAWALNWVWNQPEATLLLSGMGNMTQLEENLSLAETAREGMLGETEQKAYRETLKVIKRACKINCTGCNYCMPCPRGVNIPACFSAYNAIYSMGYVAGMHQFVTSTAPFSERSGSPGRCVRCGKCETHCPQNLPIMKHLKQVERRMEPFWFKFFGACARAVLHKKRKVIPK
jgi:predicted aldo/keto reductase-like oxidoreductase